MGRAILLLLALAALAAADPEIINDYIDQQIEGLNAVNSRNEQGLLEIPPGSQNDTVFSKGFLFGLDTLERRGNCIVEISDSGERVYTMELGFRRLLAAFGRAGPVPGSTEFSLPDNRLHAKFAMKMENSEGRLLLLRLDGGNNIDWSGTREAEDEERTFLGQQLVKYLNAKMSEDLAIREFFFMVEVLCM